MKANVLRAGAATSNITPAIGASLNGSMRDRISTDIHDELHARCLVLDDGETSVALVVCDSCMLPGEVIERAKHQAHEQTEIPPDRMMISATHTHSAPTATGVFQSEPDDAYLEFLVLRIADGIRRAQLNLVPAEVGWGAVEEPSQVFNRRWRMKPGTPLTNPFGTDTDRVKMNPPRASEALVEPAGPIDPTVSILAVRDTDGKPLAVLANYSLHYVGGTAGAEVSADYFGMFAEELASQLGTARQDPPFVGILSNGTSGNINNIDFRRPSERMEPYAQMRKVAHVVADRAVEAYRSAEFRGDVTLAMSEEQVTVGARVPTMADIARARRILGEAAGAELKSLAEIYARETVLMENWSREVETVVQAIRVGELGIATIPCETFVETGLAIKELSPLPTTFTVSLANDYRGYLPTAEHHALGGYETWRARSSYLDAEAEGILRSTALDTLSRVANDA